MNGLRTDSVLANRLARRRGREDAASPGAERFVLGKYEMEETLFQSNATPHENYFLGGLILQQRRVPICLTPQCYAPSKNDIGRPHKLQLVNVSLAREPVRAEAINFCDCSSTSNLTALHQAGVSLFGLAAAADTLFACDLARRPGSLTSLASLALTPFPLPKDAPVSSFLYQNDWWSRCATYSDSLLYHEERGFSFLKKYCMAVTPRIDEFVADEKLHGKVLRSHVEFSILSAVGLALQGYLD